jgi:hypothetical protein
MKVEARVKPQELAPNVTTRCCYSCGEKAHFSRNLSMKREVEVEYEEKEPRDLIALRRRGVKKKHKKDISQRQCYNCKELRHYSRDCPEKKRGKEDMLSIRSMGGTSALSHVTTTSTRDIMPINVWRRTFKAPSEPTKCSLFSFCFNGGSTLVYPKKPKP